MNRAGASARADVLSAHALGLVAFAELSVRVAYHRMGFDSDKFVLVGLAWLLAAALQLLALKAKTESRADTLRRLALLICAGCVANVFFNSGLLQKVRAGGPTGATIIAGSLVVLAAAVWLMRAPATTWPRARRTLLVGGVLFWLSQFLLVWWAAPNLVWPPRPASGEIRREGITVFLLLDEMNAKLAPPFVEVLRQEGLQVAQRTMKPVGPNTINVLPEMFSGRRFGHPKPCTPTAICSRGDVLDFGRITASRDDIDVIGFYHPYCAIQGLRTCVSLKLHLLETLRTLGLLRWECAIVDRLGWNRAWRDLNCGRDRMLSWNRLTSAMLTSIWEMPVWSRGGMLFAHLPLPHPPGTAPQGTLQSHYLDNAERARVLVREMAVRARQAGRELHLVIFSDHPFRQKGWCYNHREYSAYGCKSAPEMDDDAVPLIVAGPQLPDLAAYDTNGGIFNLHRDWP